MAASSSGRSSDGTLPLRPGDAPAASSHGPAYAAYPPERISPARATAVHCPHSVHRRFLPRRVLSRTRTGQGRGVQGVRNGSFQGYGYFVTWQYRFYRCSCSLSWFYRVNSCSGFHVFGAAPVSAACGKDDKPRHTPAPGYTSACGIESEGPRRRKAGGSPSMRTSHRRSQPVAAYPAGTTCDQGAEMSVWRVILEEADLLTHHGCAHPHYRELRASGSRR